MKNLKYLAAYSVPLIAFLGVTFKSFWVFATPLYAFGLIPVLEIILKQDSRNLDDEEKNSLLKNKLFDTLLHLNLPIVYALLAYTFITVDFDTLPVWELTGLVFTVGIVLGSNGINVGHELGHRQETGERFLGKLLLLPSFYMHFYIEHNYGHHQHAATKEDPATASLNQSVYSFWVTSVIRQYLNAWKIQRTLLTGASKPFIHPKNDMLWYSFFQASYVIGIYYFFGSKTLLFAILAGISGFLLLETINYIEHYGLLRKKNTSGRYERVSEIHSWNSNHILGRIMLYELTRHSDHHHRASKKYQVLDCHETSPQMPFGYPTSMVLSLMPPLWFKVMNPRIPEDMKSLSHSL